MIHSSRSCIQLHNSLVRCSTQTKCPARCGLLRTVSSSSGQTPRHAADTLVRDLATTLGYEVMQTEAPSDDGAEVFAVSDEFGIIPVEGTTGPVISKLSECFDKLWSLDK